MFDKYHKKYPDIEFRYLRISDYSNGLFDILGQLTKAPQVSKQKFVQHLQKMYQSNTNHVNIVGVDSNTNKLVAFGSILICNTVFGKTGKIQNIVTCKTVRGKGYGKVIIQVLKDQGWKNQCNKITLFCQNKNVLFYEKLGFKQQGYMYSAYK